MKEHAAFARSKGPDDNISLSPWGRLCDRYQELERDIVTDTKS